MRKSIGIINTMVERYADKWLASNKRFQARLNRGVMFLPFHKLADWLNRNQGLVMTVLTFVYVVATILLFWLSRKSLKTAIALEKNRLRPYVLFNISSSSATKTTNASIKNLGVTPAYNIKVSIEPKLEHLHDTESPLIGCDILFLPKRFTVFVARLNTKTLHNEEVTDIIDSSPWFPARST